MKYNEEQSDFYQFRSYEGKYRPTVGQNDPDWQFQKVQSVYEVAKEQIRNPYEQNQVYKSQQIPQKYAFQKGNYQTKKVTFERDEGYYRRPQQNNDVGGQNFRISKNPSSKSNSETNIALNSQSLEYLSSQQPSFSSKGQFTVCDDFNMDNVSPVKGQQRPVYMAQNLRQNWQIASFSLGNKKSLSINEKCQKLYEFIQELKFMKEGLESKLKQQKVHFANEVQQLKKLLFKINIKYEKQMLEFTQKESRPMSRQSSIRQSIVKDDIVLQNQLSEVKKYCQRLEEEKTKSQQKYQMTLKKYQQEIELISQQFERKLELERSSHFGNLPQQQFQCTNCINFQRQGQLKNGQQKYEVEIWKDRLRKQEENHSQAMRRLEEKVLMLQQEFQYLQKAKIQSEKTLKQKQKQIVYRQAEIQYKFKDIQKRQRDLNLAESLIEKQKQQLQRKKQKIADYELKVLKQERKQKNQIKQKEMMTSEYFNNSEKKRILSKGTPQLERSDSVSSRGSRIDINARLREIQMMRNKGQRNYDQNITSRNSSKDSRTSGYQDHATSRVTLSSRNLKDYGISPPIAPQKQYSRGNTQTIKLSQKLNKLTQTLQKELRDMD